MYFRITKTGWRTVQNPQTVQNTEGKCNKRVIRFTM